MSSALLINVRLHDGRYNGEGDWPPSPARLFQALVAAAGISGPLATDSSQALRWLEDRKSPPIIGAPVIRPGQRVMFYMPNNDLDLVGGDPRRIAEIRTAKKFFRPIVFDAAIPFLYAWVLDQLEERDPHTVAICGLAERLYQFGRGIDMAWAWAEVINDSRLDEILSNYQGRVFRPASGGNGITLPCPQKGSLTSLFARYRTFGTRFRLEGDGKAARLLFSQPPKPHFRSITYASPPSRQVYELREPTPESSHRAWPLHEAAKLVVVLRDLAVAKLRTALPHRRADIQRFMIGRPDDGDQPAPARSRVRIIPLPSIGHFHADQCIRRVLVEVPTECPLHSDDVHWAFSGLDIVNLETGEITAISTPSGDEGMLLPYGVAEAAQSRVWRTVTPAALPEPALRRRREPTRRAPAVKGGAERVREQARAATAVIQALRHAEVHAHAAFIRVQREPFDAQGERAEAYAPGTRFAKGRLRHVEVTFASPVPGPLIIGDGRFLGLGVMRAVRSNQGIHVFAIESGLSAAAQPIEIARALRRAVMARVQAAIGPRAMLPSFFSGHQRDGSPVRGERDAHLAFGFDPMGARLLVLAPHVLDRRAAESWELDHLRSLEESLTGFRDLRAGTGGRLMLKALPVDVDADPLFAPSRTWESATPYQVTRHTKLVGAAAALAEDVRAECRRRGLPEPSVAPRGIRGLPGFGLIGSVQLRFRVAIEGPLLLGRSRHLGGGLFVGIP